MGAFMNRQDFDQTYSDLNPSFLFFYELKRTKTETNYHCHDYIEISLVKKGHGIYYIDGKEYPIKEGDLIILNPGTYHKSLVSCPEDCTTEIYIGFSDIHVKEMTPNTFPLPNNHIVFPLKDTIRQKVFQLCFSMGKEFHTCQSGRYFMLKSYLIQFIVLLLREQYETPIDNTGCIFESPNKKYIVQQMLRYFNEHYQEKISLDQIAKNMYLSTFYLSKIFKSEIGESPINYLIELRMEKARDLLLNEPQLSIQSIASNVGYEDVYHFSKLFKKHFGISPTKYRTAVNF